MAMRKIKDAKDLPTNELIYFKGHAKATYMSDGRNVEEAINQIDTGGGGGEQQHLKTIFGNSIIGEGDVMDNYSMEITSAGTYTVESVGNPRIMRGGNIFPLVVDEFVENNYGPSLKVRISSDGTLTVSGTIANIPTFYLASGVIPEEYMPNNIAKLEDIQQADFDETDVESKAYIKNKTHYFYPYFPEQQLIVDNTTIGTNIASISHYFKIGGAVYKSADMVGIEFDCQNSGAPVFVTVGEELDSDGNRSFYLRHISGNSSAGAPIMFSPSGTVKTIDPVFIPENFATKGYVEQQLGNVQKGIVDVESPTINILEPNKIYVYATNTLSSITINSFSTTDALTEEYVVQFRTFPAVGEIKLPSGVMWANGVTPTLEGDTLYELSIVKTHIGETDYFKAVLTPFK